MTVTPHVGERKIFDWSRDLDHLFDSVMSYCTSHKLLRNVSQSVCKDSHRFFGLSHPMVQSRVSDPPQPLLTPPQVSGVLACSDGINPSLVEFKRYMGVHPTKDTNIEWLILEMMSDTLPPGYTQHVSRNCTYWTNSASNSSTWKHPHYDKYAHYLRCARNLDVDNQIQFQLRNRPSNSGITSLIETARIYKIRLQTEPFLAQELSDPDSIDSTISRIENARLAFQNVSHLYHSIHAPVCSQCGESPSKFCFDCRDYFCHECFLSIHDSGMRLAHSRLPFGSPICSECNRATSALLCTDCRDPYCFSCFKHIHARGGRRYHVPVVLTDMRSRNTTEYAEKIKQKFIAIKSPWIVCDGIYYNVENNFESSCVAPP